MKFDTLCRHGESHQLLSRKLAHASLVLMDGVYAGVGKSAVDDFRLPWKVTAVEDDETCVLIERIGVNNGGGCADGSVRTSTSDVSLRSGDMFAVAEASTHQGEDNVWFAHATYVSSGDVGTGHKWLWVITRMDVVVHGRWRRLTQGDINGKEWSFLLDHALKSIGVVASQCIEAVRPGNWVVKRSVTPARPGKRKIPRSHQRPLWRIITDKERVRAFREAPALVGGDADRDAVTPHARRAHYRCIGFDEDGNKRHTWVKACWVGSTEAEIRGARYRVELDL